MKSLTTTRLLIWRLICITGCKFKIFEKYFKKILVWIFCKRTQKNNEQYCASSKFFDMRELE